MARSRKRTSKVPSKVTVEKDAAPTPQGPPLPVLVTVGAALREVLTIALFLKYGLVFLVLGGAAAAFAALATAPRDLFVPFVVLWTLVFVLAIVGTLLGLRALRRRRFGDVPPSTPITSLGILLNVCGVFATVGGLWVCVPMLRAGDTRVGAIGAALCTLALASIVRDAMRYVAQR
ncbi:MAG: hypothetical protein HOO96_16935 [Polyangiaceae bacterium]|nr:hypothetical protein [Polyangiaceae bacterium]